MISEQVLRDLREIASTITRGMRERRTGEPVQLNETARQLVFRTLPSLLDEVELHRPLGEADRVQHIPRAQLAAWRQVAEDGKAVAYGEAGPIIELAASGLRDLLDYCAHLETARVNLRQLVKQQTDEDRRAVELTELAMRSPLPRNEVGALLDAARGVIAKQREFTEAAVDTTLAKDFVALWQSASSLTSAWHPAVDRPALWNEVDRLGLQVRRLAPLYDDVRMRLRTTLGAEPHTVNVSHPDGSTTVECDHTFKGTSTCVHCGKPFSELRAELRRALGQDIADAAELHLREGHNVSIEREPAAPAPVEVDVVSIPIGSALRARIAEVVKRGVLGDRLGAVQTMFILGLLDAEGMHPETYVGEPKQHVSADAAFIRFALPHDPHDARRREVLREVFAWLQAWLDDDAPLAKAAEAALAALPK